MKKPEPPIDFDHSSAPQFLEYYARASQSEETFFRFSRIRERALELLAEFGRIGERLDVVDVGCGAGAQALLWARHGHRVTALDINEPLITLGRERAAAQGLDVRFDVGSATQLPYPDLSADVVLLPELLEHVADWEVCLHEATRILRPGGLLYLSTSNKLCPRQQEFLLPMYSWYPARLKRWCVHKSLTTHPQWTNHARYPAVNWFSYFGLSAWLKKRGLVTLDRFDAMTQQPLAPHARLLVAAIRTMPPLRFLAHIASEGTVVWALKQDGRGNAGIRERTTSFPRPRSFSRRRGKKSLFPLRQRGWGEGRAYRHGARN